jgi:tubulin epsilon
MQISFSPLRNIVITQALLDICTRISDLSARQPARAGSAIDGGAGPSSSSSSQPGASSEKPFDRMNGIAASVFLNLTAGVRFEGSLNVDLNEITMNMVPYPRMQFLMSSISPMVS